MTREELMLIQKEGAAQALFSLAMCCRDRYVRAARLLCFDGHAIEQVRQFGASERLQLAPLLPAWRVICERYLSERYSPQLPLWPYPELDPEWQWGRYVHHVVFPILVEDDEVVRNILRSLGGLTCREPDAAADSVRQYVREMYLP